MRVYRVLLNAGKAAPTLSLEQPTELPLPDKPSIAVLPFTNMSNDPEQEYFSDGITDTLITDLSKIASLFVIARNSTFTYKGQAVEVGEVGRKLGVQHVVEGSIQKAGRRVRINVQLIDAPTGGHIWAERYDRELGDIFDLQDEITRKIVFALKVTLTPDEQERFRQAPTDNLDAYDCYLRGVDWYHRYAKEPTAQARQLFEQALALDPQYAGAHAFLGHIHTIEFGFQWSADRASSLNQAAAYAHKAVTLDTSLPLAHRVLGFVSLWQKQYDRAVAESERAITLDPNYADGYIYLASILSFVGRAEEAIERAEQAMRLNPYYPANYETHLGVSYYMAQRNAEALRTLQNACLRAPDGLAAHIFLASLYGELGRVAEARAEVAEIVRLSPTFTLESFQQDLPVRASTDLERILAALHKAGLE
jgi:adenylate cyclase